MSHVSYTVEGFRAAFRRPSLTFAEIAWRWMVGATAAALCVFALLEYIGSLPVTSGELLLLRSKQAFLLGPVLAHILQGSLSRVFFVGLIASVALGGLWTAAASIGRAVVVGDLIGYFAERGKDADGHPSIVSSKRPIRTLISVNFLRAALALSAILALVGAAIVASFASAASDPQPVLAFAVFFTLAGLICWACWALNWLLSLASIFAARDGEDALGAVSAAVTLCRERTGAVFAVSTWTGILHFAILLGAASAMSIMLGMVAVVRWRMATAGMILVALVYFAFTDWLYVARLAGYVSILALPAVPASPVPLPPVALHSEWNALTSFHEETLPPVQSDPESPETPQ
jgi:hypothetical protein